MGINFGCGDIGMAQQHLQGAQIRPPFQKMRCKGMTQDMRADPVGGNPGLPRQILDHLTQADAA